MPNVWTHILFCDDVMEYVPVNSKIREHKHYFNLGAQGPDPFFYHDPWPWTKHSEVNDLGLLMHRNKCGVVLQDMIEGAKTGTNETKAYTLAFITHHVLDRVTHPYIHYRAGYEDYNHQKLETIIDTLMMANFRDINTWENPVYEKLDIGLELNSYLAVMVEKILLDHFGDDLSLYEGFFQKSYQDMKLVLRIVYDPHGWKSKLLSKIIPPISHRPINEVADYLNERHEIWHHSATQEPSTESFIDLYKQARDEAVTLVNAILQYWENPMDEARSTVINLLGNISYDTGRPLSEGHENKYAEPIV
ncbi:zinc dependent phospholipase C family protein [Piscibacillus halophilus]|uniref:Zinc dependent phospholipase C n=1 Tax=Piscibacillus halophilus TaxID=571933 RepID=A0A1H9IVM2_9BACI|nr:zinc dependent phospholipase C family protein [Piscibacillus halophilus]SEQ78596.1 Zinc dependent phospholipase C [Piscibacillus halophilus]